MILSHRREVVMMFKHVSLVPPDAIFGLSEAFPRDRGRKDHHFMGAFLPTPCLGTILNYWKVGKLEA